MDLKKLIKTKIKDGEKKVAKRKAKKVKKTATKKRGRKSIRTVNHRLRTEYKEFTYGLMLKVFQDIPEECIVTPEDHGRMVHIAGDRQRPAKVWMAEENCVTVIVDGSYRTYPLESVVIDRSGAGLRIIDNTEDDPYREAARKMSDKAQKVLGSRKKRGRPKKSEGERDQLASVTLGKLLKDEVTKVVKKKRGRPKKKVGK
jgi:hypothetical protein